MATEVKVPVLPESVSDATIASWHKKAGDAVRRDENLLDLETDKVVLEVPSPYNGVLKEILNLIARGGVGWMAKQQFLSNRWQVRIRYRVDGVLKEIRFEAGATVNSQQVVAVIEEGAVAAAPAAAAAAPAAAPAAAAPAAPASAPASGALPPGM